MYSEIHTVYHPTVVQLTYYIHKLLSVVTYIVCSENVKLLCRTLRSHHHPLHLIQPQTNTAAYQYSYYPRTINDWNQLPIHLIEINSNKTFQTELNNYLVMCNIYRIS